MSRPSLARLTLSLLPLLLAAACGDDASSDASDAGSHTHDSSTGREDGAVSDDDAGTARDGGETDEGGLGDRAGTRLHATGVAVDELFYRSGIHDQGLETSCGFMDLSPDDGEDVQHCVPSSFTELRFASADCTDERLLVRARTACQGVAPGDIVRAAGADMCGGNTLGVRKLGAPATDTTYYRREYGSGDCIEDEMGAGMVYLSEPVDLDALVSGRIEAVPSGESGLELEQIVGSDGSRFPLGLRWSDGTRCDPWALGHDDDDAEPCLPSDLIFESDNTYVDSACSETVFSTTVDLACGGTEIPRHYGLALSDVNGCQRPSEMYTLGDPVDFTYTGPPETCSEGSPVSDEQRTFARGEGRPFDTVPSTLRRFHESSRSSRLRMEYVSTQAGEPIFSGAGLFDTELDEPCQARLFADGSTRCLPSRTVAYPSHFADDECTIPAYVTFVGGCNPARELPRFAIRDADATDVCLQLMITEVRRAVPHTGTVYALNDTECSEWTLDPSEAAFVDGEVIDPEELAEVTLVGP